MTDENTVYRALSLSGYTYDSGENLVSSMLTVPKPEPNLLPEAVDDSYSTPMDTPLTENVMANDTVGEAPTGVTVWGTAMNGTVVGGADGGFTYTPDTGFSGTDTFGYTITDANGDSLWSHTFGSGLGDQCWSVQQTSDSGYILAGPWGCSMEESCDLGLVKTNSNGTVEWIQTHTDAGICHCHDR